MNRIDKIIYNNYYRYSPDMIIVANYMNDVIMVITEKAFANYFSDKFRVAVFKVKRFK